MKKLAVVLLVASVTHNAFGAWASAGANTNKCSITTNLPNEDNISGSFWFMLNAAPVSTGTYFAFLDASNVALVRLLVETTPLTQFGNSTTPCNSAAISTGVWYFIAWHRTGTTYQTYLNGSSSVFCNESSSEVAGAVTNLRYMNRDGSASLSPNGKIAAMKLWNADMSAAQLANEMYSYRPRITTNLYHSIPGFYSTDAQDYSGNGNACTLIGLSSTDGPPIAW